MSEHFISREDAERDLLATAAYLAEAIQSSDGRAQAMSAVVPHFLSRGQVDLAAELSNTVDDPFVRDRLLIAVAETCAAMDDDEYALQLADALDDPAAQARAREHIGIRLAQAGQVEKARAVADSMEHRDNILAAIAVREHAVGSTAAAEEAASEIGFPFAATQAFVAMAAGAIEKQEPDAAAELLDKAAAAAEDIEHPEERIRSLVDIGSSFIAAGQNGKAIETFDRAKDFAERLDNMHRDGFLASTAVGFLRAGSVELADRTLDAVSDKTQIATALLGFSREQWRNGDTDDAIEALEEGYAILRSERDAEIRDSRGRFALFGSIASQFAGFEKGERAIGVAQEIVDEELSMRALSEIAKILVTQSNDQLAHVALQAIPEDAQRTFALIGMSDAAVSGGQRDAGIEYLNEAHALAEEVPQIAMRADAYTAIAARFLNLDDHRRAREVAATNLSTAAEMRDESSAAAALANLADVFREGNFEFDDEALETVRRMLRPVGFQRA